MADLEKTPPDMIILVDNDANPIEAKPSIVQARELTEFWKWLNDNYREVETIEDFHFYQGK